MLDKKSKMKYNKKRKRGESMGNTKENGEVNFVIYRDSEDSLYTAVCLNFDIVEHGKNLEELKKSIEEAAKLHLESVIENNLSDNLLNRSAPQKYWKKLYEGMVAYEKLANGKSNKSEPLVRRQTSVSDVWNRNSRELALA